MEPLFVKFHMVIIELDILFSFDFLNFSENQRCKQGVKGFGKSFADNISSLEHCCFQFSNIFIRLKLERYEILI